MIWLIGSGRRANKFHASALNDLGCEFQQVAVRNFTASGISNCDASLVILCVPKQYRFRVYLKLLQMALRKKPIKVLVETPSSLIDVLFSFLPFFEITICEVVGIGVQRICLKGVISGYSYIDTRLGADHSYAMFFRMFGFSNASKLLFLGRTWMLEKKQQDGCVTFKSACYDKRVTHAFPNRERDELQLIKSIYRSIVRDNKVDFVCQPINNWLLKILYLVLSKKRDFKKLRMQ